jgi:large subunit ribosomal protein L29
MTKVAEFFAMDGDELESRLVEARRELLNLRFQLATGQLDNVAQIKGVRRDVARIMTVLREMEIAETEGVRFEAPAPQPARVRAQRRDREIAEARGDEEIEVGADDEIEPAPRRRRSSRVEEIAEETPVVDDVAIDDAVVHGAGADELVVEEVPPECEEAVRDEPEPAPARTRGRRSRKAEESPEPLQEASDPAPARTRGRRSRKVEAVEAPPLDEAPEAAPARTRGRRSRKAEDNADPQSANEEQ